MSEHEREPRPDADAGPAVTGDPDVDAALRALDRSSGRSLADRVEAAARAHRVLQERLRAPGAEGDVQDGGRRA